MPSITYAQYCKIASVDSSKTSEKKEQKKLDEMKDLSYSDFFGQYGSEGLNHFTVAELKEELQAQGLGTQGLKAELISRLEEHYGSESHKRKSSSEKKSDKKHQKTDSSMEVDLEGKNEGNVIGGYKATIHNPNVSEEAKEHAQQVLDKMGVDADEKTDSSSSKRSDGSTEGKNPNNVAGGFKATLHNENASDEAKEHAKKMLEEMGVDADADDSESSDKTYKEADTEGKNKGNVIGGYKATLHNPNVSDEAKENAKEQLEKLGADADEKSSSSSKKSSSSSSSPSKKSTGSHVKDASKDGKNPNNVAGGYKATLKNPNASEEAKNHAKDELKSSSKA